MRTAAITKLMRENRWTIVFGGLLQQRFFWIDDYGQMDRSQSQPLQLRLRRYTEVASTVAPETQAVAAAPLAFRALWTIIVRFFRRVFGKEK